MAADPKPRLTPEQYLAIERASDVRHEYYNGEMWAMSGGTQRHAKIIMNLGGELRGALKGRPCSVMSDLRTSVAHDGLYTYPDVVVGCGDQTLADDTDDMLWNPPLIIEVPSRSTEAYDRGFKFEQYRQIESLREYVLVSQGRPLVEVYRRQSGGDWLMSEYKGLEAVCVFESVNCRIPLAEIYYLVAFDEADASPFAGRTAEG